MSKRIRRLLWTLALLLLAGVLLLVNLPGDRPVAEGVRVGERLPEFSVRCLDGSSFSLSEQRGKVVVLNLWATWCAPCVQELPGFDRLQRERPEDLAVLAVHSPPVTTDVADWLADYAYELPFAVDEDGSLSARLGASDVLPQTLILDRDGVVIYNQAGALSYEKLLELVNLN